MSLKLKIKCDNCNNAYTEDWDKILNYRGIRPGMTWGIDKIRFYALPTIYCAMCHYVCVVELFEETKETEIHTKPIARFQ